MRFGIILLVASAVAGWGNGVAQANCGIMPIKPIIPIGCKDVVAQCQCDRDGCRWVWVCVR